MVTMGHWRAVHQVHLEDGLKFGLSAWIHFAGTSTPLQKCEISPLFLQRSCVCSCSPGLSGSSRNVPAHFPSKKMQCWGPNLEMICAFLQSWSLQNPANLSGPGIRGKNWWGMSCTNSRKKSYQTVDIWTSFLPYFFFAGILFSAALCLPHHMFVTCWLNWPSEDLHGPTWSLTERAKRSYTGAFSFLFSRQISTTNKTALKGRWMCLHGSAGK